jgi:sulfide:quinone oxidoreductase
MSSNAIVVGGGFAGLEAAIRLRAAGIDVTLVSDRPYLWIYPTSIWVVTGEQTFEDVCLDLSDVAGRHGFTFRQGKVESISGARRAVVVDGQELVADTWSSPSGGPRSGQTGSSTPSACRGSPRTPPASTTRSRSWSRAAAAGSPWASGATPRTRPRFAADRCSR